MGWVDKKPEGHYCRVGDRVVGQRFGFGSRYQCEECGLVSIYTGFGWLPDEQFKKRLSEEDAG